MLQIALRSPVPCPFLESYTVGKYSGGSNVLMVSSLSLARHSPKFPHSSLGSLSLLGTQVSWLLHLGKSGRKIAQGEGARVPYKAGFGQQLPMCPSLAPPRRCLSTKCPSGRRVKLLRKGTQVSLIPDPVPFSADSERLGQGGVSWESVGLGQARGKDPQGRGGEVLFSNSI